MTRGYTLDEMLLQAMRQLVAHRLQVSVEQIAPDARPGQLLSQTEQMLLALDVESQFNVDISDAERQRLQSLGDWVRLLSLRLGSGVTVA